VTTKKPAVGECNTPRCFAPRFSRSFQRGRGADFFGASLVDGETQGYHRERSENAEIVGKFRLAKGSNNLGQQTKDLLKLEQDGDLRSANGTGGSARALYAHYGCQFIAPKGWINFDASWTLRWERIPILGHATKNAERFPPSVRVGDIVKGLPLPQRSCAGVYASHVLEHLPLADCHQALDNTYALLRDGGIFRAVVPDLEWASREYIKRLDADDPKANDAFLRYTEFGQDKRDRSIPSLVYSWLRTSRHYWMWEYASLSRVFAEHGFRGIRRCQFGDCEDEMFRAVESPHRFVNAVAIEARR
jgi:predicted SAM-dependent methyltransferase